MNLITHPWSASFNETTIRDRVYVSNYIAHETMDVIIYPWISVNSLSPRQNRRHFAYDVFKCNFLNENVWIPIEISLKFVPKALINNIPALVQIMAWRRTGDKPLSEPMMTQFKDAYVCHSASMS